MNRFAFLIGGAIIIAVTAPVRAADPQGVIRLNSAEIEAALTGKRIAYSPPGTADAGVNEEFRQDGTWSGRRLSFGPMSFNGQWRVKNDLVCTTADDRSVKVATHVGEFCRKVWRDATNGDLIIENLTDNTIFRFGPQRAEVSNLSGH